MVDGVKRLFKINKYENVYFAIVNCLKDVLGEVKLVAVQSIRPHLLIQFIRLNLLLALIVLWCYLPKEKIMLPLQMKFHLK